MDKVAKYSIMEELGRGSEGVVFRAMDVDSQRQLALKTIKVNPELPDDDPELLRIIHATEEQCKKLSEIEHRNVARVFEAGYQDGVIYIARELIEGKTLKWYMEDTGKVKVEEAVEMVKDIAKGLKAIHKLGIVMGGLKPSDIMIRPGVPVIVGFGLPAGLETEGIIRTTRIVESVIYLAPEVVEGSPPTGRSDIYSLGLLLYSMLAGGNPFEAGTVANALINVRVKDFEPVDKANTKVPGWLARVVRRSISRNPEERYATVDEFLDDLTLRSILKEEGVAEEEESAEGEYQYLEEVRPKRRDRRLEYFEAGIVVLAFVVLILLLVHYASPYRYIGEERSRHTKALEQIATKAAEQQRLNPEEFDLIRFLHQRYKGDWAQAYADLTKDYSLYINQEEHRPTGMEALRTGGRVHATFTVIAFPSDELNPLNLSTFGIRDDLVLRVWDESYGEFEDVTTWKVFK